MSFFFLTHRGILDDGKDTFYITPDTGKEVSLIKIKKPLLLKYSALLVFDQAVKILCRKFTEFTSLVLGTWGNRFDSSQSIPQTREALRSR